ncbi:MAG: IS66 family insertion sequence element accessory protein TnpA [Ruminococcus sp.]
MPKKNPRRTDKEWLNLIQECRSSGLSDKCWCQEHHIHTSNFYYQIRRLRQKACEIPGTSPFFFLRKTGSCTAFF